MTRSRESVYAALFALASKAPGLVTMSRRPQPWANVPAAQQPALFQHQTREQQLDGAKGMPYKWELLVDLVLYTNVGEDPNATPSTQLNILTDAIEAMLPVRAPFQTLGGLVSECRIHGAIQTDEGALGAQGVAIIPVRIVTIS